MPKFLDFQAKNDLVIAFEVITYVEEKDTCMSQGVKAFQAILHYPPQHHSKRLQNRSIFIAFYNVDWPLAPCPCQQRWSD